MRKQKIPQTSRTAHNSIKQHKAAQHKKILQALQRIKGHAAAYERIAQYAGMDRIAVARRLSELVAANKICPTNQCVMSSSNRPCMVYKLVA